jgi:cytochrome c oxidase assembly protein subunit 15
VTSAEPRPSTTNPWLARYAKLVVVVTFALILLGGLVTTFGAGMAVPTWPTINGEMNPAGWWQNHMVLLEHSHRLTAITVGLLTAILCAWVWRNGWALAAAFVVSGLADAVGHPLHLGGNLIAQLRIWPAAAVFLAILLLRRREPLTRLHWLALIAYLAVCVQATLGGLRVTEETAGALSAAMALRIVHGCFAQVFLALVVVLAAQLSPIWQELTGRHTEAPVGRIRRLAWVTVGLYFAQLIVAAAMRHPGAGLAIPTWPKIGDDWLPSQWTTFITLNFLHTRVISILLTGHTIGLACRVWLSARHEPRLFRPGVLLGLLVVAQFVLGVLVVWQGKQPGVTTAHVFNAAGILATSVLLVVRAGRLSASPVRAEALPTANLIPARA